MRAVVDKVVLGADIWVRLLRVRGALRKVALSDLCRELGIPPASGRRRRDPVALGRAVWSATSRGPIRPRCLSLALVHYRLLTEQGLDPVLVIGLPEEASSKDAHAWVELDGVDVGPPPGRGGRRALARYSRRGPVTPE